jgi:hypothetical protein
MPMKPISLRTQLTAMERLRAGATLAAVARDFGMDPERLNRHLSAAAESGNPHFAEYPAMAQARQARRPGGRPRGVEPTVKPHRPVHDPGFPQKGLPETEPTTYRWGVRVMSEFSAVELEALQGKLTGWVAGRVHASA